MCQKRWCKADGYKETTKLDIYTEVHSDYLSDDFIEKLKQIPIPFGSFKVFYPKISFGQDAIYFIGKDDDLRRARQETGRPVLLPGENIFDFISNF